MNRYRRWAPVMVLSSNARCTSEAIETFQCALSSASFGIVSRYR